MTRTPIFEINSRRERCPGYKPEKVMLMVSSTRSYLQATNDRWQASLWPADQS